jgi:hypothetical protein
MWRINATLGFFYMPQICDMGQAFTSPQRKACRGFFFALKNPTANLGTKGQHATSRPSKTLCSNVTTLVKRGLCNNESSWNSETLVYIYLKRYCTEPQLNGGRPIDGLTSHTKQITAKLQDFPFETEKQRILESSLPP